LPKKSPMPLRELTGERFIATKRRIKAQSETLKIIPEFDFIVAPHLSAYIWKYHRSIFLKIYA